MNDLDLWTGCVVGIIDAHDALHYKIVKDAGDETHDMLWPTQCHKRWRFWISARKIDTSVYALESLTLEDQDRIMALMKKILPVPRYEQRLDAWDAAGRPRGKKYDKWLAKWDKENPENP